MKIEIKMDGRKATSGNQIERELIKAAERALEGSIRKAAGPGVKIKKTRDGYVAEGTPEKIDRLTRQLR
ncbi:hypothetical protein LAZ29_04220 [Cereibacter sphaeroides]|uniref:hypothetical protein n=1 Tax=Cereibacter sphaeroides TaxID=1063 RepID=UPI001F435557|nr:hypothetical protein [Cereibacter sphaeroides]MCE6950124.1 hypothetical protein [Cereibacter sphaeroides]